jgi:hypothetical protein
MTTRPSRLLAALPAVALCILPSPPAQAGETPAAAPRPVPTATLDAGVQEQTAGGRRVIADSQTLVWRAGDRRRGVLTVSDLSRDEAANIERINATRGTYQSYLLATREDLPVRLFHPGFTITLPPPRKRPPAVEEDLPAGPPPTPDR